MYSIVGLEEPPGSQSVDAEAINNSGQVVGEASLSPYPHNRAYLWSEGVPQDLGELLFGTLETVLERPINNAYAINNSGQVVGASGAHAFLWDASNGVQDLGTLPGDQNSRASAINDSGQVAGESGNRAFLWSESTGIQDLGTLPVDEGWTVYAHGYAINDYG
jgi:probable HAF family extracellular repeat protein